MVKKESISAYFKGKNFYISLLVGVCAVVAITAVYVSVTTDNNKDLVDLNEPLTKVAEEQVVIDETSDDKDLDVADSTKNANQSANDNLLENDIVTEDALDEAKSPTKVDKNKPDSEKVNKAVNTDAVAVMNPGGTPSLKFNEEDGLLWPIKDNPDVIMKYSMERGILFQTLMQYKCNPAIIIASEVGQEVLSAADGIITEISSNEETGLTLKMSIGNDYNITYGQLKDCTVDVGDTIKEGDILGKVEKPTKYYIVEGNNLYFQVTQKGETVDPLFLLR